MLAAVVLHSTTVGAAAAPLVEGDGIPARLAATSSAARGRALVIARDNANCVLCHAFPDSALPYAGNVGPSLEHVGSRLSPAQIRLRIVDNARINPATLMPSYYRAEGLDRVAPAYRGRTILTAQEVEDLVAYLATFE